MQLDILSEKWLELDTFDVVLCGGVLYHVENVISFLFRLRRITAEALYLETKIFDIDDNRPLMLFKPSDERTGNPSNWWFPNEVGLMDMLTACGFTNLEKTWENPSGGGGPQDLRSGRAARGRRTTSACCPARSTRCRSRAARAART